MQVSIVNYSELPKYDFNNFLWSPDFFQEDRLKIWSLLESRSNDNLEYYFQHIKKTVKPDNSFVGICYDLTDSLSKFFEKEITTTEIGSTKKVANADDFAISRLRSYLKEMGLVQHRKEIQLFSTEYLIFRAKTNLLSTYSLFALCMTTQIQTILKRSQYGTV